MRYLFAILLPPLAVIMCGKFGIHLIISIVLTLLGWLPGVIHACLVVSEATNKDYQKKQYKKIKQDIKRNS